MMESRERVLLLLIAIFLGLFILQNPPVIEVEKVKIIVVEEKRELQETSRSVSEINNLPAVAPTNPPEWLVQTRIDKSLEKLGRFIQIPEQERIALVEKLRSLAERGSIKREDVLQALSAESSKTLLEKLNAVENYTEEEERDKDLYYLSRILKLTPEQESLMRTAIEDVQAVIKQEREKALDAQRDLMASHGSHGMQGMSEKYTAMEQLLKSVEQLEKSLLKERTEKILSVEQYKGFADWLDMPREGWSW